MEMTEFDHVLARLSSPTQIRTEMNMFAKRFFEVFEAGCFYKEDCDNEILSMVNETVVEPGWYEVNWCRGFDSIDFAYDLDEPRRSICEGFSDIAKISDDVYDFGEGQIFLVRVKLPKKELALAYLTVES